MIGGNYTEITRDAWGTVPGRHIKPTYDGNNKPIRIDYCEGENIIFSQILTYDNNGNMIDLECVAPSS